MQKTLLVAATLWIVAATAIAAQDTNPDAPQRNEKLATCLDIHLNLERLNCLDALFSYTHPARDLQAGGDRNLNLKKIDAEIRDVMASKLVIGDEVAVRLISRETMSDLQGGSENLAALFGPTEQFEALRARANLHMALRTPIDSPTTGVLSINCRRDITEFWLLWQNRFDEELSRVWVYASDNLSQSEGRPTLVEYEPGERLVGFPRGLPSIELLRWLAAQPDERFAIEAGVLNDILVFERAQLKEMIRAQRRYCSWR